MELTQVTSALGLEAHAKTLAPGWAESQQSLPAGEIEFLTPSFLRRAAEEFPSSPEGVEAATAVAAEVAGDPALRAFAWHFHSFVYRGASPDWHRITHWPDLKDRLGERAGLLNTLVLLSGLPRMHAEHEAHAIPSEVIRKTLSDVHMGLARHHDHPLGIHAHDVGWFANFLRGELYRLGRLQFQFGLFGNHVRAFRHRESGAVLALSDGGVRYRADGQAVVGDGEGWPATLEVNDTAAAGCPILPTGKAVQELVTLPAVEWEQVLSSGDPVLHVHIPGNGREPMAYDACGDSFRQALQFFPQHYPAYAFRGFSCWSWILDTWFQTALPPTSNMARFQREVYLFPTEAEIQEVLRPAFDYHKLPEDLSQLPRKTSLQRALLEVLEAGGQVPWGGGACFLLREDVRWGEEVYRRQVLPLALTEN